MGCGRQRTHESLRRVCSEGAAGSYGGLRRGCEGNLDILSPESDGSLGEHPDRGLEYRNVPVVVEDTVRDACTTGGILIQAYKARSHYDIIVNVI